MQILKKALYLPAEKQRKEMESFYRTHAYLVEHTNAPVRRDLMDEIDWSDRLIGIKGTRGVGKTTFLLQYAKNPLKAYVSKASVGNALHREFQSDLPHAWQ